jgi:hypothetical protein
MLASSPAMLVETMQQALQATFLNQFWTHKQKLCQPLGALGPWYLLWL